MSVKVKTKFKYGICTPTSMGVRITPPNGAPVHLSDTFFMQATSAESNVINVSSSLGYKGLVLTNFVKDNPISLFIKSQLRARNIDFYGPDIAQGGPWGYRHQFNIADSGYGSRGPRVHNDRAGEVGRDISAKDFDLEKIFGEEGVAIVHCSGLFAALSPETCKFTLEVMRTAKKHGSLLAFDMNYRASFWKGREKELRAAFSEIAGMADILVGNEEDFQLALGIEGPEAGGKGIGEKIDSFKEMINRVKKAYPNASIFGTTLREVISVNEHLWGAVTLFGNEWTVIDQRPIHILDRIGGGDGFVSGLLYGVLKGWSGEKSSQFGWATGALATTVLQDYGSPADEEQVWSIYEGNARVKR